MSGSAASRRGRSPTRGRARRRAAELASILALAVLASLAAGCAGKAMGRPWVHKLEFVGIKHVPVKDLEQKISLEASSWNPLTPRKYLDPFAIQSDRPRIEAFFRARGYYSARVVKAEVLPRDKKKTSVDVVITVDEGKPTRVRTLSIEGLEPVGAAASQIRTGLPLAVGDPFDYDKYDELKQRLVERLKAAGFAFAGVKGAVDVDRDARTADLRISVTTGPRTVFGSVEVRGQKKIDPALVARAARIAPGAAFDPQALADARGRIYGLGVFSSVKVSYQPRRGTPGVADVKVDVREGSLHELRVGGGLALESQRTDVHASLIYTRRNFLGGLRTLRLRLEPAYVAIPAFWSITRQGPGATVEAQFTQPSFPWKDAQLHLTVGYDLGIDYAYQYHGPHVQLGVMDRLWESRVGVALSTNLLMLDFFNTDPAILTDASKAGRLYGYTDPYLVSWLEEELFLDLRDRPLDAHKGLYLGFSAEEGVWTGGAFYEKIVPELRAYVPIGSRVTFASRGEFGWIFTQGGVGSPRTQRLYLGGANSHRGFTFDRLSPQVDSGIMGTPPLPIGGDQMVLLQVELRVNIVKLWGNWLSAANFFDAGDVVPGAAGGPTAYCPDGKPMAWPRSLDLTRLHLAVGGGLRYHTVIGTIRADVGVRLNRTDPCEADHTPNPDPGSRFAFHLSVGEAF